MSQWANKVNLEQSQSLFDRYINKIMDGFAQTGLRKEYYICLMPDIHELQQENLQVHSKEKVSDDFGKVNGQQLPKRMPTDVWRFFKSGDHVVFLSLWLDHHLIFIHSSIPRSAVFMKKVLPPHLYMCLHSFRQYICLLYTSPSPRDGLLSRMPSSA
eukprot:TRINITY_DN9566_c0_g1_i4.p1 TRINITY_DN9566_c0_g1~~TRINITY_DN9566_c0_g1_i4.p1  ORF type:complete len:157 (+),score=0.75 TRINITY_DN9566_c0_g1_i4:264-734(+)